MTATAEEVLAKLIALNKHDLKIRRLDQDLKRAPASLKEKEDAIKKTTAQVATIESKLKQLRAQILIRENPLRKKGLNAMQRYLYFDAALYPFSALFTLIFIMIPIFFCLSGIPPFQMNDGWAFVLHFLPFYLTGRIALYFATRDVDKNDVWREQQLQYGFCIIYFMALVQVFTGKRIKFAVTKKDGSKSRHPLVYPLFVIEGMTWLGIGVATARYFLQDTVFKNTQWAKLMEQPWVYLAAVMFAMSTITHLSTILAKARSREEGGKPRMAQFHRHNLFVVASVLVIGFWQQMSLAAQAAEEA